MIKKSAYILLTSLSVLMGTTAQATTGNNNTWFPHTGRVSGTGAAVSDVRTIGGDSMLPIYGQFDGPADAFTYVDFMGDYGSDDTWLVSPGLGYRKVISNQIIGGYFFGDYQRTSLSENFWVLSPGLEWMNTHWDAHVNGYFPTKTSQQNGSTDFASNYELYNNVTFVENTHEQHDMLVTPSVVIGNGVDAEIAYSFAELDNLRSRVYLGGYYYAAPGSYQEIDNITGVTAGFEQPINKNLNISLFNSYDNINNYVVGVSLTATFGQESTVFSNNINDRLLDPVQRHVGIIDTAAGEYDQQGYKDEGMALQYDNVYFISETGSGNANGTYGNAMQLTQDNLDVIDEETSSSRIYIQGDSTYQVNEETTGAEVVIYSPAYGLRVHDGQDFYGRSTNYTAPADEDSQPIIAADAEQGYNGFVVSETGENTFSDLTITEYSTSNNIGSPYSVSGILVYNNTDDDMTVNVINTNITGMDTYGLYAQNNQSGNMVINTYNSTFNHNGDLASDQYIDEAAGLYATNDISNTDATGTLTINAVNSEFNNNATGTGNVGVVYGLYAENSSNTGTLTINATHSEFNQNGNNNDTGFADFAFGLSAQTNVGGDLVINAMQSEFNNNGTDSYLSAIGLYAETGTDSSGSLTINATESQFNENGTNNGIGAVNFGVGLYAVTGQRSSGTLTINTTDSQFNDNGVNNSSGAYLFSMGLYAQTNIESSSTLVINATDSQFNGNGANNGAGSQSAAYGLYATTSEDTTGSLIMNVSGSQFNNNGINYGTSVLEAGGLYTAMDNRSTGDTTINVTDSEFNGNGATYDGSVDIAMGFSAQMNEYSSGDLTIDVSNSQFNNNGRNYGTGTVDFASGLVAMMSTNTSGNAVMTATGSEFNGNGAGTGTVTSGTGMYITNHSTEPNSFLVTDLSGSTFNNNKTYGIYGNVDYAGTTSINYSGATFSGNPEHNDNSDVNWMSD